MICRGVSNINNSYLYIYPNPYTAISCWLVIKETLPISIFLEVSTVNKVETLLTVLRVRLK